MICFNCKEREAVAETRDGVPLCKECGGDLVASQPGPSAVRSTELNAEETVASGWEAYCRDVKPSAIEQKQLREAFYSGAYAGHVLTLACLVGDEATCEAKLFALSEEVTAKP